MGSGPVGEDDCYKGWPLSQRRGPRSPLGRAWRELDGPERELDGPQKELGGLRASCEGLDPTERALEPAKRASVTARRASQPAGRPGRGVTEKERKEERKGQCFPICGSILGHFPLQDRFPEN